MDFSSDLGMAQANIHDTVRIALGYNDSQQAMIIFDEASELSSLLAQAYQSVLPDAAVLDFDRSSPEAILKAFDDLSPGALVVLIQSASFRLSKFRIRIELFNRQLKVIEHPHLERIRHEEYKTYFESLAYDADYYRQTGSRLAERVARAKQIKIITEGGELTYDSAFEDPRLNIGHYERMKNIGGQFPIGEIFTEPKDISRVNGPVKLFAFGDNDFSVNFPDRSFTAIIEAGLLVSSPDAPQAFQAVLDDIRIKEDVVWVRELGFGLNRALTRSNHVSDIGTYERMCGVHLSLGAKHLQYKKPDFPRKQGFHVDIFVDTQGIEIDGVNVFKGGRYIV